MSERLEHPRDYAADANRRRWLILGGAGVLVLVIVAYFLLRDDGEDNRAAYCDKLEQLTADGTRLEAALSNADKTQLDAILELAPASVHPAWNGLAEASLTKHPTGSQEQVFDAKFGAEVDKVVRDAQDNCSLTIDP
jgi:hypothetical protein